MKVNSYIVFGLVNVAIVLVFHLLDPNGNPIVNYILGDRSGRMQDSALLLGMLQMFLTSVVFSLITAIEPASDSRE